MNYTINKLPKSQIEITVSLPFKEFRPYCERASVLLSQEIKIEGFREGKAPYKLVAEKVGEMKIYERAAQLAVEKTYLTVLTEIATGADSLPKERVQPLGRPEIIVTKLAPGNDLEYKIKLFVLPDLELPDYKAIAKKTAAEKKDIHLSEEEIKKALEWIASSRSTLITVNRPAQKGDEVEIDLEASPSDTPLTGGSAKKYSLRLGSQSFIPGFEEELMGMKEGEEKTFDLSVPADYHEKNLAGKTANFKVKINLVQERKVPPLTDEFAKTLGNFSLLEDLRRSVKEGIAIEKEKKEAERIRLLIIENIADGVVVEIPAILIEGELSKMLEELKGGIENMGMPWSEYLTHIKKTEEDLKKEWRKEAEKRVKIALILKKIADLENINPTEAEIEESSNKVLRQYSSSQGARKSIDEGALRDYARGVARNEKVFKFLEGIAG